jgi:ACR3 family arsenite efflux pump ArsB
MTDRIFSLPFLLSSGMAEAMAMALFGFQSGAALSGVLMEVPSC